VTAAEEGCTGCPYCCRVKNPSFTKQCSLNAVLILDNTISLAPYCFSSIIPAVASFTNGLNSIVGAGGNVNLGVLLFQQSATVVFDMAPATPIYLDTIGKWIGNSNGYGSSVSAAFPVGTQLPAYCTNLGATNWAVGLLMATQFPWAKVGVPDIHIMFTDGTPLAVE
jgi:hypothetical protein